jgi:ABC-type branched-subunit amino acid transport system substrate-binding protein
MKRLLKTAVVFLAILFCVSIVFAGKGDKEGGPIKVGHLSYHTGAFADVGPWFDGMVELTLNVINEDPPLGRELVAVHQDIGTIGEAAAARKLLEQEGAEILLNAAHEYLSYRDWLLGYIKENDSPLMPSVHGGGIRADIGGIPTEPIFRGAPMDSGQSVAAVIKAKQEGAKRVVLMATEIEGSQLQMEAAIKAAREIGLNVVDEINVVPEATSYRTEVSRIADSNPDALLFFSQAQDGATVVKQTADAGLSLLIIGTTEWLGEAFPELATESAMRSHKAVWISGFSYVDGPAFADYQPRFLASEYLDVLGQPENSYNIQYFDVLVVTALAIEAAGSTNASEWAPKVREVAMGPGKKVYTYKEGIAALRAGEDIDYSGCTGEFDYGPTGTVSGLYGIFEWSGGKLVQVATVDGKAVLELDKY